MLSPKRKSYGASSRLKSQGSLQKGRGRRMVRGRGGGWWQGMVVFQIKQGFCSKNSCRYNMHVWTLIGYESTQKTCRGSDKTQTQHGEGGGTQSPIHGWGTISNASLVREGWSVLFTDKVRCVMLPKDHPGIRQRPHFREHICNTNWTWFFLTFLNIFIFDNFILYAMYHDHIHPQPLVASRPSPHSSQ